MLLTDYLANHLVCTDSVYAHNSGTTSLDASASSHGVVHNIEGQSEHGHRARSSRRAPESGRRDRARAAQAAPEAPDRSEQRPQPASLVKLPVLWF